MTPIEEAAASVRECAGSAGNRAVVDLCDALIEKYTSELETVPAERLAPLQARLAQVRSLRKVLIGDPHASGLL